MFKINETATLDLNQLSISTACIVFLLFHEAQVHATVLLLSKVRYPHCSVHRMRL